jgi:hypothetical protein
MKRKNFRARGLAPLSQSESFRARGLAPLLSKYLITFSLLIFILPLYAQRDTSYISIAPQFVLNKLVKGKAPVFTLQLSGYYNIGLLDLADNDNTAFRKEDFGNGRNFGTRYGYGVSLSGKIALHKAGNIRLTVSPGFQRFQSNFVISASPSGKVHYNVFSGGLGIENNFTPFRPFKPYIGFEALGSFISGDAMLKTDSGDVNIHIKSSFRIGFCAIVGFEYAFNNVVGINLGARLTHANVLLRDSKTSADPYETYLNDEPFTPQIPYTGWKQFYYASFTGGVNFYFGMKNKK